MRPAPVGTRIRVIKNDHNHNYDIGRVYKISQDDNDGTFKAVDANGKVGNWLRWEECELAGPDTWARIAADLPEELVRFLSCFDGIADISLSEKVVDAVLGELPDLHERVVEVVRTPVGEPLVANNRPGPLQNAAGPHTGPL